MHVVIGEDETLLADGLALLLEAEGISVVGVARDADQLLRLVHERSPEVVLTDIRMPPGNADDGLKAALEIRRRRPGTPVVILSQHVNRRYALELLADGSEGIGYLLKQRISDRVTFCADLRRVAAGGTVLDPEVVAVMLARARRDGRRLELLTPRQAEVLELVAQGRSNAAIARVLVISEKAVVQHVSRIYDHLGLAASTEDHRRVLAVVRYLAR